MRKSSKALWIALIVVALVCVMALGAMASVESTAVIYGETVDVSSVKADETFDVVFKFKENNTKIECGKITLTWDGSKMTAGEDAVVASTALAGAKFESKIEDGKAVIAWAGSDITGTDEIKTAGDLFTVKFTKTESFVTASVDVEVNNLGSANWLIRSDYADSVVSYSSVPYDLEKDDNGNILWNNRGNYRVASDKLHRSHNTCG